MPGLLRIQPAQAQVDSRQVMPGRNSLQETGKALGEVNDVGETLFKLNDGADKANATKFAAIYKANGEDSLKLNAQRITDPEEFRTKTAEELKIHQENAFSAVRSPNARKYLEALIGDDAKKFQTQLEFEHYNKIKDGALGDTTQALDSLEKAAIAEPNDDNRRGIAQMVGNLIGGMTKNGYMKKDDAGKELVRWRNRVESERLNLEAAQDPVGFYVRYKSGDIKGDSTAVQRALDIAGKVADHNARQDKTIGDAVSRMAERAFEQRAEKRELDVDQLNEAARWYGWPKEKVDGLINMQIGIKVASPYEKQLIEHAMTPVDSNARPGAGNVATAERNLRQLLKDRNVSADSQEYRGAMRRLQGITRGLDISGDMQERRTEFDARQGISDLYHQYLPGNNSPRVTAERAEHMRKVDAMPANERRAYVKELEQKFEKQKRENQGPQLQREKLRGLQLK